MQRLAERQGEFARALLDPARAAPVGLVGPDGASSAKRFSVYRSNVIVGLIEALEAAFPATRRIVGDEFFRAMARAYVLAEPPTSPILLTYGAGLPDFIAAFEPAASLPYLPDVARIERAWSEAYHARDAVALEPEAFAAIPEDLASDLRLTMHPSVRIIRSEYPALTIWRMNVGDGVPEPVDLDAGGEDALVARPIADVEVRAMPEGGAEFLAALTAKRTLTDAAKCGFSASPRFDLSTNLAALISAGIFIDYSLAETVTRNHLTGGT